MWAEVDVQFTAESTKFVSFMISTISASFFHVSQNFSPLMLNDVGEKKI